MRVLFIAGYTHPVYHRKLELLADAPDVELLHVTVEGYGRPSGVYPSANGQRHYRVLTFPAHWLGSVGDPHRSYLWPPHFGLREFQPDLIQAESDLESLGTVQVTLARWVWARSSRLIHYSWQNILRPRRLPVRLLTQLNLRSVNHLIASSWEAVEVAQRQGYRGGVSVLPLVGLDTRYFFPAPSSEIRARLGPSDLVVGFVGRLVRDKGVDLLLRACAESRANLRVLIVGDGPERTNLAELANQLGLSERCHFAGAVEYDQAPSFLNAMDVLVLPSRTTRHWKEQFGRVLMEAMGCRVVVLGSDSGAIPEVIGAAEQIFPEENVTELTGKLQDLVEHPERRRVLAEQGYRRALENYAVEHLAMRLLNLWRNLIGTAG